MDMKAEGASVAYTATVGARGRITIPKPIRDSYGLKKGTTLQVELAHGRIRLRKKVDIRAVLEKYSGIIDIGDVDEYIEELRGR